ncbi:MAG: flagellar basal body rod protein FlgF [Sphingopyxis sp.]
MDRLIHTALASLRGAMARQTVTANNLANVATPGFRAEIASAQAMWINGPGYTSRASASLGVVGADMHAGTINETARDLDIAIVGDALLAVQDAEGGEAYTRRGDLQIAESGLLTTGDGHPVLGEQGPITLPPADRMRIDSDGSIWVVPRGGDPETPQRVDRLKLASAAGSTIRKGVDTLFHVPDDGALPADPDARVSTGHLEQSNVNATQALVAMIEASRSYETQMRLVSTAQTLDQAGADLMRLPE